MSAAKAIKDMLTLRKLMNNTNKENTPVFLNTATGKEVNIETLCKMFKINANKLV